MIIKKEGRKGENNFIGFYDFLYHNPRAHSPGTYAESRFSNSHSDRMIFPHIQCVGDQVVI